MRCFWKLFAVFAAVLLMTATAAAAEADTGEFRYECESMVEAEPVAMMCAEPAWSSADVGYGDQLHGDADLAYTAIADAFANGNVVLKGEFWSAGVALKKSFTAMRWDLFPEPGSSTKSWSMRLCRRRRPAWRLMCRRPDLPSFMTTRNTSGSERIWQ